VGEIEFADRFEWVLVGADRLDSRIGQHIPGQIYGLQRLTQLQRLHHLQSSHILHS
jgi:hypothetical protein